MYVYKSLSIPVVAFQLFSTVEVAMAFFMALGTQVFGPVPEYPTDDQALGALFIGLAGLGMLCALLARVVALFVTLYRANANVRSAGAALDVTPWGMIGWFFVPVASIWKPFTSVRELFAATETDDMARFGKTPGVVSTWWAVWVITGAVSMATSRSETAAAAWVAVVCVLAQAVTSVLMIRDLSARVTRFAERGGATSDVDDTVAVFS